MSRGLRGEVEEIIIRHLLTGYRRDHDWWMDRLKLALRETAEADGVEERVLVYDRDGTPDFLVARTASGKVLTEADLERLADEAERGYDITKPEGCLCAEVFLNRERGTRPRGTGSYNWNPDCPVHPWTDEMQAQADRAVDLQLQAREARRQARLGIPEDGGD